MCDDTKIIGVEEKVDLITSIIEIFKVGSGACLKLKYFDPKWDCDTDIDEARELPDRAKVTVTVFHKVTVEHDRTPLDLTIGTVEQVALTSPSGHKAAECEPRTGSPLPTTM